MKKLLVSLSLLLCFGTVYSQTPEEMKAWEANMTPGEHHTWLASMDGYWNAKVKMWMDPSQPASESDSTTKNEMIMNGLYQRSTHTGHMMGMPFQGESITAYDNFKKKFVSTWIDNMGSGIMMMEGTYDDKTNSVTLTGGMADPATGKEMNVKQVLKIVSPDEYTLEMYMVTDNKEIKTMEIVYTKAKG